MTILTPEAIEEAEAALIQLDPVLGALISSQSLRPRAPRADYFSSLCSSIIGQQVSVFAARAILGRFEEATKMDPRNVLSLDENSIKQIGLSRQKATYLHDLAQHFIDNPTIYNHLETQSDEAIITELTAIKGIGPWTAQMFLMFTLARPDIFAPDDVGLQNGMKLLYGWETVPPKKQLVVFAEKWKPYRTVASLHLWESLNNEPA